MRVEGDQKGVVVPLGEKINANYVIRPYSEVLDFLVWD